MEKFYSSLLKLTLELIRHYRHLFVICVYSPLLKQRKIVGMIEQEEDSTMMQKFCVLAEQNISYPYVKPLFSEPQFVYL